MQKLICYKTFLGENVIDAATRLTVMPGDGKLIPEVEKCLSALKIGEIGNVKVSAKSCFGKSGSFDEKIPPNSTVTYQIEYISDVITKQTRYITFSDKFSLGSLKKDEGNEFFKDKKFDKAKRRYQKAINCLHEMQGFSNGEMTKANDLLITCYSNLAMTLLNLKEYSHAIQNCDLALKIDPNHIKARFRRAQGYLSIEEFDKAKQDLSHLRNLKLDSSTTSLLDNEMMKLSQLQDQYDKKSRKMFNKVFE